MLTGKWPPTFQQVWTIWALKMEAARIKHHAPQDSNLHTFGCAVPTGVASSYSKA